MFKNKKLLLLSACLLSMSSLFSFDADNLGKRVQATDTDRNVLYLLYTGFMETGVAVNSYIDPYLRYFKWKTDRKFASLKQASDDKMLDAGHALAQSLVSLEVADKAQVELMSCAPEVLIKERIVEIVVSAPQAIKASEIKTRSWGDFLSTWGYRAKYAVILSTAVGLGRTIYNYMTTSSLIKKYNAINSIDKINGEIDKNTYLAFAKHLASSGNREQTLTLSANQANSINVLQPIDVNIAIKELEDDLKTLRFFAQIKNPQASYHALVANPVYFATFNHELEHGILNGFFAKSQGVVGIPFAMDYYYGHDETLRLIRQLVLQIAALQEFVNVKSGLPRTILANAVPISQLGVIVNVQQQQQ